MGGIVLVSILRIENNNGSGPYACGALNYEQLSEIGLINHGNDWNHPNPYSDGITTGYFDMPQDHVCGFNSFDQLFNWFTDDELKGLNKYGFDLVEYLVPEKNVKHGKCQVIFIKP
jgi:hypothetical protein